MSQSDSFRSSVLLDTPWLRETIRLCGRIARSSITIIPIAIKIPSSAMMTYDKSSLKFYVLSVLMIGSAFAYGPISIAQGHGNHALVWGSKFRSEVARCWKPLSARKAEVAKVILDIRLTRDGRLAERPIFESPAASGGAEAYQQAALQAIIDCQPYELPAEYYDEWKYFAPVFIPNDWNNRLFETRSPSICRGC
jgi:hypothetical protein